MNIWKWLKGLFQPEPDIVLLAVNHLTELAKARDYGGSIIDYNPYAPKSKEIWYLQKEE